MCKNLFRIFATKCMGSPCPLKRPERSIKYVLQVIVQSVASSTCYKLIEKDQGVASNTCYKVLEKDQSVASSSIKYVLQVT